MKWLTVEKNVDQIREYTTENLCDLKSNEIEFEEEIAANDDISIEQTGMLNDFGKERKSYCKIRGVGRGKIETGRRKIQRFS